MNKKFLRPTISQLDVEGPLKAQPARDNAAMILPISAIRVGKNIRDNVGDLDELTQSIRAHGILQSLLVKKSAGGLELVAGHRRLEAAKQAGLLEVPVRIVNATDNESAVLRLVENLQRENLSGWETCKVVHELVAIFETQSRVAQVIGKDKGYVSKCVSVVEGRPDVERVQHLPLRELFAMFGKSGPPGKPTDRKPSGPIPGGRAVDRVVRLREHRGGRGFTLNVHFDFDKSSDGDRERLLAQLRELIRKLEPSK